jgi:hypothetical protein
MTMRADDESREVEEMVRYQYEMECNGSRKLVRTEAESIRIYRVLLVNQVE